MKNIQTSTWQAKGLWLNRHLETFLSLYVPVSMILGLLFSHQFGYGVKAIPWLFAYLTFVMTCGCSVKQIVQVFKSPLPMVLIFVAAHLVVPLFTYGLTGAVFGVDSPFVIGFVLFTAIPLGISAMIWIGVSKGNVAIALSMIVVDSLLSPLVIPGMVEWLFGAHLQFDAWAMMRDLVFIIVIPTILGVTVNELSKQRFKNWSAPWSGPTSKLAMFAVVMINAAAIAPYVVSLRHEMLKVLPMIVLIVAIGYVVGYLFTVKLSSKADAIAVIYCTGMRNISLGLVLALAYFEAISAVPVVLSILLQQPVASFVHWLLERRQRIERKLNRHR